MIKTIITLVLSCAIQYVGYAQVVTRTVTDTTPNTNINEQKTVTIRLNGKRANTDKTVIEIDGDKILYNGKDINTLKDVDVQIGKAQVFNFRNGESGFNLQINPDKKWARTNRLMLDSLKWKIKDYANLSRGYANKMRGYNTHNNGKRAKLGIQMEKCDNGVKIQSVTPNSAAEKAGLKDGDIITRVNNETITGEVQLSNIITSLKPNDVVSVDYLRNNKTSNAKATLLASTDYYTITADSVIINNYNTDLGKQTFPNIDSLFNGFEGTINGNIDMYGNGEIYTVKSNTPKLGLSLKETLSGNGLEITVVTQGSAAANAGLQAGDIINSIDGVTVNTVTAVRTTMRNKLNIPIEVTYLRNGKAGKATIAPPAKLAEIKL